MGSGSAGRNRRSIEEWRQIVDGKDATGLGVREYCKSVGIVPTQFYKYQRRLRGGTEPEAAANCRAPVEKFIDLGEVRMAAREWTVELELSSGVTIRVR